MSQITSRALTEQSLRARESECADGTLNIGKLLELEPSIDHWARTSRAPGLLKRLGVLFRRVGQSDKALKCLTHAFDMRPEDRAIVLQIVSIRMDLGESGEALRLLAHFINEGHGDGTVFSKAALLAKSLGNNSEALEYRRKAAELDRKLLPAFVADLIATSKSDDVLPLVREELESGMATAKLAFQCFSALKRFSTDVHEIEQARDLVLRAAASEGQEPLWRARIYRREGALESALEAISPSSCVNHSDPEVRRERAAISLALGYWGRDADIIADAADACKDSPHLRSEIVRADRMLRLFGASLDLAANNSLQFANVRTPESIFEYVIDHSPPAEQNGRGGVVMIANTLAAGGAERIIATCAKHISRDHRINNFRLYLFDISPEMHRDFYLPLANLLPDQIKLLDTNCEAMEPHCFLPHITGRQVQCILNELKKDRPRIVHASLEPLNLYAGLAAVLAGTERIILHTHNMRPTALVPDGILAPRMLGCYRALMRRPEVSLVGCADACVKDYREWLGLDDTANTYTVHNGIDFADMRTVGQEDPIAGLRKQYGLEGSGSVIGTAFRFEDVKRPFMWVDIAAMIHSRRPDCRFVMFGDGTLRSAVRDYIIEKQLGDAIILPGLVPELHQKLMMLDLFVLCSRIEALPNVLLEAQASGVPVVAFDVGGIRETLIDGITGILVKDGAIDEMANRICGVLEDTKWNEVARKAGMSFVRTSFSTERMVENLVRIMIGSNCSYPSGEASG